MFTITTAQCITAYTYRSIDIVQLHVLQVQLQLRFQLVQFSVAVHWWRFLFRCHSNISSSSSTGRRSWGHSCMFEVRFSSGRRLSLGDNWTAHHCRLRRRHLTQSDKHWGCLLAALTRRLRYKLAHEWTQLEKENTFVCLRFCTFTQNNTKLLLVKQAFSFYPRDA